MNFDTIGWIISAFTGVATLITLVWTRMDESRSARGQLELDKQRHGLDTERTSSDIQQQIAETQLRMAEGVRGELEAMTLRYRQTNEELRNLVEKNKMEATEMCELFDKIETTINATKCNGEIARLIMDIRKFRRLHAI